MRNFSIWLMLLPCIGAFVLCINTPGIFWKIMATVFASITAFVFVLPFIVDKLPR